MKNKLLGFFLLGFVIGFMLGTVLKISVEQADGKDCKGENAECNVNNSDKLCCSEYVCMDKGVPSDNGKCQLRATPTPTITPTLTNTPVPTATPTKRPCHKTSPTPTLTPTPTPTGTLVPTSTPTPTEQPKGDGSPHVDVPVLVNDTTQPPRCLDKSTIKVPANPHVIRNGSNAIVKWFQTEGSGANIYYKEVGQNNWTHSVRDLEITGGFGSVMVGYLNPSLGYVFGIQQKNTCAGGEIVTAVIVDSPEPKLFTLSYWTIN